MMRDLPQNWTIRKLEKKNVFLLGKLNGCCSPNSVCSTGDERNPTRIDHWMKFIGNRHGIGLVG